MSFGSKLFIILTLFNIIATIVNVWIIWTARRNKNNVTKEYLDKWWAAVSTSLHWR